MYGPLTKPEMIYKLAGQLEDVAGIRIVVFRENGLIKQFFIMDDAGVFRELPYDDWIKYNDELHYGGSIRWWDMSDADYTIGLLSIENKIITAQYKIENETARISYRGEWYPVFNENGKRIGKRSRNMKFGA